MRANGKLAEVSRDELRHLEHRDFCLSSEHRLELVIREDVALVARVLKVVLLDVFPHLLNYLRAGHRACADDCLEF